MAEITDKELAMRVVDRLEECFRRLTLMQAIIETSNVPGWRQRWEELIDDPAMKRIAHQKFASTRERILDAPDLTTAVREMLKDIPKSGLAD